MKIAQIAPLIESVPPKLYGGTERIVSYLTEELVALGHHVTLLLFRASYQTSSWFWESVIVWRRLLVVLILTFVSDPIARSENGNRAATRRSHE